MSPPKISLSGKEPLKPDFEEFHEKCDGAEFPSVIMVETEHRARNFRRQAKRRQCKRIICGIILVIFVAVAALLTLTVVNILRRHHRKAWTCKSFGGMPTNVKVDHENQLISAAHDHDDLTHTSAWEILHVYYRGLVAYKDVDNNTCYIDRLDETFAQGYERWESYEKKNKDPQALKVISQPIEAEVLEHIGFKHIFAHCQNAESFWVMEIKEEKVTADMRITYV